MKQAHADKHFTPAAVAASKKKIIEEHAHEAYKNLVDAGFQETKLPQLEEYITKDNEDIKNLEHEVTKLSGEYEETKKKKESLPKGDPLRVEANAKLEELKHRMDTANAKVTAKKNEVAQLEQVKTQVVDSIKTYTNRAEISMEKADFADTYEVKVPEEKKDSDTKEDEDDE